MKLKYKITGVDCPVCASKLCTMLAEIEGVINVKINFFTQRLTVESERCLGELLPILQSVAKQFSSDVEITK